MLTVGSLFSGIGGIDLGLERAGMTVRWQCELDPFCSQVLKKHWPDVPNLGDVTKIDWETVERVDLICGGYPCQPFSIAGQRAGAEDERHLWPYFRDALRVLRPRFALLENVPGHLSLGFGDVLRDLAALGYDTEWDCIPAAAVGAPHRRDRVFAVAHTEDTDGRRSDAAHDIRRWNQKVGGRSLRECGLQHWRVEPDVGRVAARVPRRVDRLRALGNAVVPQVAEYIGRRILEAAA